MRIKLDENMPHAMRELLEEAGHDVEGVVVFRLHDQRWDVLEEPARRLVASGALESLAGGLAIVDETRVRMRRAPKKE